MRLIFHVKSPQKSHLFKVTLMQLMRSSNIATRLFPFCQKTTTQLLDIPNYRCCAVTTLSFCEAVDWSTSMGITNVNAPFRHCRKMDVRQVTLKLLSNYQQNKECTNLGSSYKNKTTVRLPRITQYWS